jgi:hypothetical protein
VSLRVVVNYDQRVEVVGEPAGGGESFRAELVDECLEAAFVVLRRSLIPLLHRTNPRAVAWNTCDRQPDAPACPGDTSSIAALTGNEEVHHQRSWLYVFRSGA